MPFKRGIEEAGTDETEGHMPRIRPDAEINITSDDT